MIDSSGPVLVLAPHPDDGHIGCGGTLARYAKSVQVYYSTFSFCEASIPDGFPINILVIEMKKASEVLGISNLPICCVPVRDFPKRRQWILDTMIELRQTIKPGLVFVPSSQDIHQDHQVITQEAMRAFKHCSILGYELPWNNFKMSSTAFVSIGPQHLKSKIAAIEAYKSQAHRDYMQPEFTKSLARVRGLQAGIEYAEAFEVIRWIVR